MKKLKPPKALDAMVAVVLAYRPKPKTKLARKRQLTRRRLEKSGAPVPERPAVGGDGRGAWTSCRGIRGWPRLWRPAALSISHCPEGAKAESW
jgi:hypothetical protein